MGRVGEQDINDGSMKKPKKKKNKESISSNEEVHNVQVGSRDPKKLKSELGNADVSGAVGDLKSDSGADKTPEKEKIMQNGSITDATHRENDNKKKREREKNKVNDKEETSSVLEAPKEVYSERKSRKKDKSRIDEINEQEKVTISTTDGEAACDFEKGDKQAREEGQVKEKKKKKGKNDDNESIVAGCNDVPESGDLLEIQANDEVIEKGEVVEHKKRKKKKSKEDKKEKRKDGKLESGEVIDKVESVEGKKKKKRRKECDDSGSSVIDERNESADVNVDGADQKQKKKKKKKKKEDGEEIVSSETNITNEATEPCDPSASRVKMKKVTFSEQDEVFPVPKSSKWKQKKGEHEVYSENGELLIRGKRFSKEEDEIIKKAILAYIEEHKLGENGVQMVMSRKKYPEIKDCWKEIRKALPLRPIESIYSRAHIIFQRSENCTWTREDFDYIKKFYEKHGPKWKQLAEEMGRHRVHVKDAWRRIKLPNVKSGDWSQNEYQQLFDLVNLDLSMKVFQEKKTRYGMLRDNIGWETISQKLATRSTPICCMKWYDHLSSPLVAQGNWTDSDDYRLLIALTELDASCEDDVDWDNLLEHRSGDLCRERWKQMVRHIGYNCVKPFIEQVEVLSKRYCPDILEAREEYENRPAVD